MMKATRLEGATVLSFIGALILLASCAGPFAPSEPATPSSTTSPLPSIAHTSPAPGLAQPLSSQVPLPSRPVGPAEYTALDVSDGHVCAIRTDGSIGCWGTTAPETAVPTTGTFVRISINDGQGCAVRTDRTLECWTGSRTPPPSGTFRDVGVGSNGVCALDDDSRVECWGFAEDQVIPPTGSFSAISAGSDRDCGIRSDGRLACWSTDGLERPGSLPAGRYTAVSTGDTKSCAIRTDRTAACWGFESYDAAGRQVAVKQPSGMFREISVGYGVACGIRPTGALACWGADGSVEGALVPGGEFTAVSAAGSEACAIRVDKALICWGGTIPGRAVPGDRVGVMPDLPLRDPSVLDVSAGYGKTCVIRTDQSVGCWTGDGLSWTGSPVPSGTFDKLSAGFDHVCGIRTDGTLSCWGLQDPPPEEEEGPSNPPPAGRYSSLSVGDGEACAIRADAMIVCWAIAGGPLSSPAGQFSAVSAGVGGVCAIRTDKKLICWSSEEERVIPPAGEFIAVDQEGASACGIHVDGALECWGSDDTHGSPPTGAFTDVDGTCGLRRDGTLACWGVGDVDANGDPLPPVAPPLGTFRALDDHCAIRTEGTLLCWDDRGPRTPVPTAYVTPQRTWVSTGDVTFAWGGSGPSPVVSYDVDASWLSKTSGRFQRWLTGTDKTQATVLGSPGTMYCIAVLAHDADGLVSSQGNGNCVETPQDDRAFAASRGWKRLTGDRFYRSTATQSSTAGAKLTLKVALARLALVATTCHACGTVQISGVTEQPIIVSLASEEGIDRKVIEVDLCRGEGGCPDEAYEATLTLEVISQGRPVIIDGVAAGVIPE